MTSFKHILDPVCAAVGVAADTKEAALAQAVEILAKNGKVPDSAGLLREVLSRESLAPTAIGEGVALPHALSASVPETMFAVLRLARAVDFGADDGGPVDIIFLIAGPRNETSAHLKLLSKLARLLHDEKFRAALRSAADGRSLAELLYEKD
ncbi:PTS sugar transporter subunit IIA [Breznakiella homolactica]|uniref:PTS sugar transporter subunit IIA n=1 Tax=Breznakiella homolactica TaxID=2798577 RepID=A0A7T7XR72_9SPIR|nr:PTS sugar transporter subunit IIA [Breznakiella homolactica]QQO10991.1 PTS sugar transporter subunit IIA [Breznakiella homolactica]